jgi:hypothetical protein
MSYAIANLKELDDMAVQYGLSPAIEAHFGREALGCEITGVSYQRVAPNTRHPLAHRHGRQEEIYVVLSGRGRVKLDDEIVDVEAFDAIRVAPQVGRAFEAAVRRELSRALFALDSALGFSAAGFVLDWFRTAKARAARAREDEGRAAAALASG